MVTFLVHTFLEIYREEIREEFNELCESFARCEREKKENVLPMKFVIFDLCGSLFFHSLLFILLLFVYAFLMLTSLCVDVLIAYFFFYKFLFSFVGAISCLMFMGTIAFISLCGYIEYKIKSKKEKHD